MIFLAQKSVCKMRLFKHIFKHYEWVENAACKIATWNIYKKLYYSSNNTSVPPRKNVQAKFWKM